MAGLMAHERTITLVDGRPAGAEPRTRAPGGVFTTLRSARGRVLFLHDHLERLARTAAALALPPPDLATLEPETQSAIAPTPRTPPRSTRTAAFR